MVEPMDEPENEDNTPAMAAYWASYEQQARHFQGICEAFTEKLKRLSERGRVNWKEEGF
jgi:hypothetical protein